MCTNFRDNVFCRTRTNTLIDKQEHSNKIVKTNVFHSMSLSIPYTYTYQLIRTQTHKTQTTTKKYKEKKLKCETIKKISVRENISANT